MGAVMGMVGLLRSFAARTVDAAEQMGQAVIDLGGGDRVTAHHYSAAGIDARPLADDFVAAIDGTERGSAVAVAYLDPAGGVAAAGEVRVYARDGDGAIAFVHVKNDGTITIENREGGSIEMAPDGVVTINGVVIDTDGNVTTPGEVTAKDGPGTSVGLSTHLHPTAMGPTDPPTGGT